MVERLGVGPEDCHAINPKLVYGRMTGWGQTEPWARTAGHDLNYISIASALGAMGRKGDPPMPSLNLISDYDGGTMFLVAGMLAALLQVERAGKGEVWIRPMQLWASAAQSMIWPSPGSARIVPILS